MDVSQQRAEISVRNQCLCFGISAHQISELMVLLRVRVMGTLTPSYHWRISIRVSANSIKLRIHI